jgi:signal transduction histidine kinase
MPLKRTVIKRFLLVAEAHAPALQREVSPPERIDVARPTYVFCRTPGLPPATDARPEACPYLGLVARIRLSLDRRHVFDAVLALLVVVWVLAVTSQFEPSGGERPLDGVAYVAMVAAAGALTARRTLPLAVVGVVTAALCVYVVRDYPGGPVFVTLFVALYSLANTRDRRTALGVAVVAAGAVVVAGEVSDSGPGLLHLVFVGWAAASVFLGDALRSRRQHLAALEERARQLEQSREEEARRRVAEERLRIAQDLHDSVAHSMTAISVQAGVAAHVIDRHPDRAREALLVIQKASADVLEELTALLGLLRVDTGTQPALSPTPGPSELGTLVESARRSGLDVELRVQANVDDVPQPVGVALYRIVQESLTNVVRHAGPGARATVTLVGEGPWISVDVVDDGTGSNGGTPGAGVGITGMRERTEATGGIFEAGPLPEGGFAVHASWPRRQ